MRYSTHAKPISYLKANAAAVLRALAEEREPMIITQNGEARAVIQDIASHEETQKTLALIRYEVLLTAGAEHDREACRKSYPRYLGGRWI